MEKVDKPIHSQNPTTPISSNDTPTVMKTKKERKKRTPKAKPTVMIHYGVVELKFE
jgi:hypothetical protein